MVKRGKKASALQTISDDNAGGRREGEGTAPMEQIMDLIQSIENGVEEKVASIMSAAEDAVISLKNDLKAKIMRLPKPTRELSLKDFQEKYPDDFKTGALQEIRQRYAAMAEAAQQAVPPVTGRGLKRVAEPVTVLRTVKARRTVNTGPLFQNDALPPAATTRRAARGQGEAVERTVARAASSASPRNTENLEAPQVFNGRPLQTPMPFAGHALPIPVTMLAKKGGGRTKAAPVPDAAVVTTADGMQWALGKEGVAAIPESHRTEVAELLSAQFNFLAEALGRTVFDRQGGRGRR